MWLLIHVGINLNSVGKICTYHYRRSNFPVEKLYCMHWTSLSAKKGFVIFTSSQFEASVVRCLTILKRAATYGEVPLIFSHYNDRQMKVMASQITGHLIACLTASVSQHQRVHQISALLVFCQGNPLVTGEFPYKGIIITKRFPCSDA